MLLSRSGEARTRTVNRARRLAAVSILGAALTCWIGVSAAFATAPANDSFANATAVGTLPFSDDGLDTTQATTEAGEPLGGCAPIFAGTVWYAITPSKAEALRIDTTGSTYLSTVSVYTGGALNALSSVACSGFSSSLTFHATANTTYYIQVGGVFSGGTLDLSVAAVPPPPNDDFANATVISGSSLPFNDTESAVASSTEQGEPNPSCAPNPISNSWWYAFTPTSTGSFTAATQSGTWVTAAAYTGGTLATLNQIACRSEGGAALTFHATAGTTYYLQISDVYDGNSGPITIGFDHAPAPIANFSYSPNDPSTADVVQFYGFPDDPGQAGFTQQKFDFGDGTSAVGCCPDQGGFQTTHQYTRDGDYTVTDTVTTTDGRAASSQQVIHVRTHDVSISQLTVPSAAKVRQTKPISATVRDSRYPETVRVDFYESTASGFQQVGSQTQSVPATGAQHPTAFTMNYTFSAADAQAGKVVFEAVATIIGARDAFPADNTAYSTAVKVSS